MSTIDPSFPISSISGRYSVADRVHARANRTTGKTYGVALTRPNSQSCPTPAQQQSREVFRATWQRVDAILAVPEARTYYTALWHAHTSACRHHRPLSQSAIDTLSSLIPNSQLPTNSSFLIPNSSLYKDSSSLIPNSSLFNSRRAPFSTPRTLLFYLLYRS